MELIELSNQIEDIKGVLDLMLLYLVGIIAGVVYLVMS